jgi:hypothetical protein
MTHPQAVSVLVAAFLIPAVGCSSTIAVHRPVTLADAQQVTHAAADRVVKVEVVAPDRPAVQPEARKGVLAIQDGGAFVLRSPPEEPRRIPFERTRSVVVQDRGKGALEGFVAGAIPGALVGLVLGSVFDEAGCSEDGSGSRTICSHDATVTLGLAGGVLAGLIGALVGAAAGHRTTFTF